MSKDKCKGIEFENVGQWYERVKKQVAVELMSKKGPEKEKGRPEVALDPTGKTNLPGWVFDNHFGGQPPLNPAVELGRMEEELNETLAALERSFNSTTEKSISNKAPPSTEFPSELRQWLEESDKKYAVGCEEDLARHNKQQQIAMNKSTGASSNRQ